MQRKPEPPSGLRSDIAELSGTNDKTELDGGITKEQVHEAPEGPVLHQRIAHELPAGEIASEMESSR